MCASVFIFRWRGGEPIGSVCLHTLVKTDVYLCEWQSYVAPTLQLASRLCQYAEGAGHSVVLQPPPPTMCAPHCCPTPEMSKEQWLFSFVQDSILHPPFPFFYSKINVPSPSSFWLAISNLLVCLLRGSCCTFVLRWSFRKWSFYMSFHGIGSNKLSFCHVIKNQPTKQQFWVQDSLKGILVPPHLP